LPDPLSVNVSLPSSPYDAGSRMRSLFGAPSGIGPLSARGKGKCSCSASDTGMLALILSLLSPETVISSSPSPPYDSMVSNALALRSPRQHQSSLGARKRKTLLCRFRRRNAREDVMVVAPGDIDIIVTVVALRRGGLGRARSSEPRRYWPPLGARERKTLLYHLGRRNAREDANVKIPGDSDSVVAVAALRRGVSDALALRSPRRHRSPLGARKRKILRCRLGRWNARVDIVVAVSGNSYSVVIVAALRRHGLKRARSSESPTASVPSRRAGKEDTPLPL